MPSSKLSISSTPVTDRRDRASSVFYAGASSAFCSGILVIALLPSSRIGNIYERVGPDYAGLFFVLRESYEAAVVRIRREILFQGKI